MINEKGRNCRWKIAREKEWIDGVKSWWASGLQGEVGKSIMAAF